MNNVSLTSNGAMKRANRRYEVRKRRVTSKVRKACSTSGKFRLSVFRSNENIYAQIIDDAKGVTLVQANSLEKDIMEAGKKLTGKEIAGLVGERLGQRAGVIELIKTRGLVFDRNGFKYHGRIAALADAVRKSGVIL